MTVKTARESFARTRSLSGQTGTYMAAALQVSKVHVRDEEDRLGIQIQEGLEHRDVRPFV